MPSGESLKIFTRPEISHIKAVPVISFGKNHLPFLKDLIDDDHGQVFVLFPGEALEKGNGSNVVDQSHDFHLYPIFLT